MAGEVFICNRGGVMSKGALETRIGLNNENGPFLGIGFGFMVNVNRVTSILPYIGKYTHTLYLKARDEGKYHDATRGRGKRSLVLLDNGEIFGSAFKSPTIVNRQV